jgi:Fe-S-cluster containining protein
LTIDRRMLFQYPKRIHFGCERCALCCGDSKHRVRRILLLNIDVDRVLKSQSMALEAFAVKIEGFEPYMFQMKKTVDGSCVFLRNDSCSIYEARPLICRFYPFQLQNRGNDRYVFRYTEECPGIGKGPQLERRFFEELFAKFTASMNDV